MPAIESAYETIERLLGSVGAKPMHGYVGPMGTGVITFRGYESAKKAFMLLSNAFDCKAPLESIEYNKDNTVGDMTPSVYKAWLVAIRPKKKTVQRDA